jgi:hypothetical protein
MFLFHAQVVPPQPRQVIRLDALTATSGCRRSPARGIQRLDETEGGTTRASAKVWTQRPMPMWQRQKYKKCCDPKYG